MTGHSQQIMLPRVNAAANHIVGSDGRVSKNLTIVYLVSRFSLRNRTFKTADEFNSPSHLIQFTIPYVPFSRIAQFLLMTRRRRAERVPALQQFVASSSFHMRSRSPSQKYS